MDAPICAFVRRYGESGTLRLHMPGHKGAGDLERWDITEVAGADSLYEAEGIIAQSEENASKLFGCPTLYSTEGSSQCIRAMVYLAMISAQKQGKMPRIAAGRNVHKTFLSAVAMLDVDVTWLYAGDSYLACPVTAFQVEALGEDVTALYLTSPDYLGNMVDIAAISAVCRSKGILLLVDNAHGAYLRFLQPSLHPMDLGADLCCDSAHKTLPVITGGAYLHIRDEALAQFGKDAMALFGSTSPSYLILQSLDKANVYLAGEYRQQLASFAEALEGLRQRLAALGYRFCGNEPMKLTIHAKSYGYNGTDLARHLREKGIECEFADPDYLVLMPTPALNGEDMGKLEVVLASIPALPPICQAPPVLSKAERVYSVRQALLWPSQVVPVAESEGRILAAASVGCPPAVPILVCGERIDQAAIRCFQYYGIETCTVMDL